MSTLPLVIDWGDVPTWVGATTTLGALIAAGVVVRIEMRRDERSVQQREREEQADKVAVWNDNDSALILLRNSSNLPIYNVRVTVLSEAPNEASTSKRSAPPGDTLLEYPRRVLGAFQDMSLQLQFTDAAGRSWQRWFDGTLRRLPDGYARTTFVEGESRTDVAPPQGVDEPPP